jgi:uncharacterized membrane protein
MSKIEESIDVMVPVHVAYNQWTQFEDFPKFMEGVEQVHQLDDTKLHWRAKVAGQEREWDARITEQKPDDRIAWTSIDGAPNGGVVTFHELEGDTTRVMLQLGFDPEGLIEKTGDALGLVKGRTKGDLDRFKEYVEKRGTETGAWRGEVEQGATKSA